ncbi:MAG: valine--tRNA ligase [Bacteroidetes bacterium]|nr:valine--tRNA ligase [Bacteroidota bacterium]
MTEKNISEIPKAYNPSSVEDKWYKYWLEKNLFHSEVDKNKKSYTIVIPPPNITGILTMGHVLNNTIQDIFIRTKRMQGYNACWVPGTDHASIATETKVTNFLKEKGIEKYEIGREEFLKYCWEWKDKYGGIIIQQLKKLGVSCDWERERFTMDEDYYKKVLEAFVKLYKEGKIYRGYRMVNWCPASKSAISDEEVIYRTINGKLWYLKYPVMGTDKFVLVATTRPETMLGDTGVAVNPKDERYKNFIGKKILLPIAQREIPIFADEYVDMEFGTGAVKVTPAHDVNDYEMGKRHKLEFINIFNDDASTNHNVPEEFRRLDRYAARKKVIERFEELGLLEKVEDYQNKVGYSERGGVPIEPYLSEQWFMNMEELVKPALEVVRERKIKFYPDHWIKTYDHWMSNIKDWCISRQLWWGHRIPVWYHKSTKEMHCEINPPKDIENWHQDEDVLDTWASSWLWAYDVFKTEEEQKYYYPTDALVTAPDIIFFWVARMIIAGLHFKKDIPFRHVYFTSVIRDLQGRKMSKSLGNSPDPLDVISEYGSDALRFTVIYLAPLGQDVLFSADKCEIGRNFANKIWNAGRFLLMNAENIPVSQELKDSYLDFSDKWINSRFHQTLSDLNNAMEKFEVNNSSKIIYSFVWNDFCDWYIELAKNRLYSDNEEVKSAVLTRALGIFENLLKLVHPFMPFITEELWQLIEKRNNGESISISNYPQLDKSLINSEAEHEMNFIQEIITAIRNIRGEMNIPPSKFVTAFIKSSKVNDYQIDYIKKLAKVEELKVDEHIEKPKASASAVLKNCEIYIPLKGLIDLDVERNRLQKEIVRLEGALIGIQKKLSNEKFVNNAAKDVVEKEIIKEKDWMNNLSKLKEILSNLE